MLRVCLGLTLDGSNHTRRLPQHPCRCQAPGSPHPRPGLKLLGFFATRTPHITFGLEILGFGLRVEGCEDDKVPSTMLGALVFLASLELLDLEANQNPTFGSNKRFIPWRIAPR